MAGSRHVTTLELNITSKTAKTFLADLAQQSKNTKAEIADLTVKLASIKAQLASKKDESGKDISGDAAALGKLGEAVTAYEKRLEVLQLQKKTFDTMLRGHITNINELGKAIDNLSGRNLKQLQAAMKEWNQMLLNMGNGKNSAQDQKALMQYGVIVKEIKARTNELKGGFLNLEKDVEEGLKSFSRPLHEIPGIIDAIQGALEKLGSADLPLLKVEEHMEGLTKGKYMGSLKTLYKELSEQQSHFIEDTKDYQQIGKALALIEENYNDILALEREKRIATKLGNTEEVEQLKEKIKTLNSAKAVKEAFEGTNVADKVLEALQHSKEGWKDLDADLQKLKEGTLSAADSGELMGNMSKVLMYLNEETDEYKKLYEVMKQVYSQDMNVDRMRAMSEALKENASIFSDDEEHYKRIMNLAAQLDARIKDVESSWRNINTASDEVLQDMQRQYEGIVAQLKQVNAEDEQENAMLNDAIEKLRAIKELRSDRAADIIGDAGNRSDQEIQRSVEYLEQQVKAETLSVEQRTEYNRQIAEGNRLLAERKQGDQMERMDTQLGKEVTTVSRDERVAQLQEDIEAWQRYIDERNNLLASPLPEEELDSYLDQVAKAERQILDLQTQQDAATDTTVTKFKNLQYLSTSALLEQQKFWKAVRDGANSSKQDVKEADERLKHLSEALAAKGNQAQTYYNERGELQAGVKRSITQTREDIADMKQLLETYDLGSESAQNLAEKIKAIEDNLRTSTVAVRNETEDLYDLETAIKKAGEIQYEDVTEKTTVKDGLWGRTKTIDAVVGKRFTEYSKLTQKELEKIKRSLQEARKEIDLTEHSVEDNGNDAIKKLEAVETALKEVEEAEYVASHGMLNIDEIANNPRAFSLDKLREAADRLKRILDTIPDGKDEREDMLQQFRDISKQMEMLEQQTKNTKGALENAIDRIKTYVMVYMSFQKLVDIMKGLFQQSQILSDSMSDIQKRTQLLPSQIQQIAQELDDMSRSTRSAQEQLYSLAAAAGLLGLKKKDDIIGFATAANQMNVALVELGEDGATQLMKIATLTGDVAKYGVKDALTKVGSSINALTAASAASAGPITDFVSRVGAVGSNARMTMADIAGLGATLDALGQPVELSATAMNRFIMAVRNNTVGIAASLGINPENLQQMIATDRTMEAMIIILETMKARGGDMSVVFGEMGSEGVRLKQTMESLMGNTKMLRDQVKLSNDEFQKGTSMLNEYNVKNENSAAIMARVNNMWRSAFSNAETTEVWRGVAITLERITAFFTASTRMFGTTISLAKVLAMIMVGITASTAMFSKELKGAFANSTKLKAVLGGLKGALSPRNLIGGVAGLVAGLGLEALFAWIGKIKDATEAAAKSAKEWLAAMEKGLRAGQDDVKSYFGTLERMNKLGLQHTKAYNDLLNEINQKYSTMIGYTITETTSVMQLAAAHDAVNDALAKSVLLESQRNGISKIQSRYDEEISDSYASISSTLSSGRKDQVNMNDGLRATHSGRVEGRIDASEDFDGLSDNDVILIEGVLQKRVDDMRKYFDDRFRFNSSMKTQFEKELEKLLVDIKIPGNNKGRARAIAEDYINYARNVLKEADEIDQIMNNTANRINQYTVNQAKSVKSMLDEIKKEYDTLYATDASQMEEDARAAHYNRLIELQQNYNAAYEANQTLFDEAQRKDIMKEIHRQKELEVTVRKRAGMLSQFGFENIDWSKMSGDELNRASDSLNELWRHYSANSEWQAFGRRVRGEGFAEQKDAKAWIDQQVAAIAERAEFLDITKPTGWDYPRKGGEKDPTQDLMNEYLKKLEDYYNQQYNIIRENAAKLGEATELTERKLYLKEKEYKAARVGLQMMYLQDLNTIDEQRQKQFKLLTTHEIADLKERREAVLGAMKDGNVSDAISAGDLFGIGNLLQVKERQSVVETGVIDQEWTDKLQQWVMDLFNADPTKQWDVAGIRAAAKNQETLISQFIADMQDEAVQHLVESLSRLTAQQTTTTTVSSASGGTQYQRDFIERMRPLLEAEMKRQNIDGTFIYSLLAQTGIESDWGRSPAAQHFNFGGMRRKTTKLPDEHLIPGSTYVEFANEEEFVREYVAYLNRKGAFKGTPRDFGTNVKKFGYAEDPNYASKVDGQAHVLRGRLQDHTGTETTTQSSTAPLTSLSQLGEVARILTAYTESITTEVEVLNEEKTAALREAVVTLYNNNMGIAWDAEALRSKAAEQGGVLAEQLASMTQAQIDALTEGLNGLRGEIDMEAMRVELEALDAYVNTAVGYDMYKFGTDFSKNIAIIHKNLGKTDPKFGNMRSKVQESTSGDMVEWIEGISKEMKEAHKILLESAPVAKVVDEFRVNMTKLKLIFSDQELLSGVDKTEGAYERRMDVLKGFSARILTMTEDEFIAAIALTNDFRGRSVEEYRVMYEEILKLRDNYDEAVRKKAKQDVRLFTNRYENGTWYEDQLNLFTRLEELARKTNNVTMTEGPRRAMAYLQARQNMRDANGNLVTYNDRRKAELEALNTRVKQEEQIGNRGIDSGVAKARAELKVANRELRSAYEDLTAYKSLFSAQVSTLQKAVDKETAILDEFRERYGENSEEFMRQQQMVNELTIQLNQTRIEEEEAIKDKQEKVVEAHKVLRDKEAALITQRINDYRAWMDIMQEFNTSMMSAGDSEAESKNMELAELRAKKSLGLVQDTERQRFLIIKNARKDEADWREVWLNEEERLEKERELAASNARREALNKMLNDMGEKMSKSISDTINHQLELNRLKKEEDEKNKVVFDAQQQGLDQQYIAEQGYTEKLMVEIEKRKQAIAKMYKDARDLAVGEGNLDGEMVVHNESVDSNTTALRGLTEAIGLLNQTMGGVAHESSTDNASDNNSLLESSGGMWDVPEGATTAAEEWGQSRIAANQAIMDSDSAVAQNLVGVTVDSTKKSTKLVDKMANAMAQSMNLYGVTYAAVTNDNLNAQQKAAQAGLGAVGQVTNSLLSVVLEETLAKAMASEAEGTAKAFGMNPWAAAAIIAVLTAAIGTAMGLAQSKVKGAQSKISSISGASSGRLTTTMLTYATGRYLDDEWLLKKGRATSGMLTMADGYQPGQSYSVDGADGHTYSAKYEGAIKETGIRRGTHFGIFSELKPEMVIDGDTTALMHNKYPMIEKAILQLHRTGTLNMGEMLGLNYAAIGRTIDTLSRSGSLSFPGGMRMPTFAAGRYPGGSMEGLDSLEGLESLGSLGPTATQQADIDSRNRLAAAIEAMVQNGVSATMSTHDASKKLAKQKRFEKRAGISDGLYGG